MIKIFTMGEVPDSEIFAREDAVSDVGGTVSSIIADVRLRGDEALYEYTRRFDGAELSRLEVTPQELDAACDAVDKELMSVMERAAENIRAFHLNQKRGGFDMAGDGVRLGQRVLPLERAGLYIPGGTAAYPSTVLMNCIPAKIAGVGEIILVSPPTGGSIRPEILAAAKIAGADRVFKIGGAQAVAALAYGTESVPRVDKIVGPGNAYVAEAKKQVFGRVAIDMIAGPSEILIVSDGKSNPGHLAADMLSQAEHDRNASAVLVTDSAELAAAVARELERQTPLLPRRDIAAASIERNGKIIISPDIPAAIAAANTIAPEHLELCVDEPMRYLDLVKNAGSVFLGRSCPEALGDYYAGPNHTLPTGGTARFSSPLGVDDFVRRSQYIYYTPEALGKAAGDVARFAETEGLSAHARSVLIRGEKQ